MPTTSKFVLPLMATNSIVKETIFNEAALILDRMVQPAIVNRTTNTPPGSPVDGDMYIVGPSPTGVWVGHSEKIAIYFTGWLFYAPQTGWLVWDTGAAERIEYDGADWVVMSGSGAGVSSLEDTWVFDTSTASADPGTGELRLNNATIGSVTALYISQTSDAATDVTSMLDAVRSGDQIYISDATAETKWVRLNVSSSGTDNGAWWDFTVTVVEAGAGGLFTGANVLTLVVDYATAATGTLDVEDEGSSVETGVTVMNFVGAGVVVTNPSAGEVEVSIAGGGGGWTLTQTLSSLSGTSTQEYDVTGDEVLLIFSNVAHSAAASLAIRVSFDSGTTKQTTGYVYVGSGSSGTAATENSIEIGSGSNNWYSTIKFTALLPDAPTLYEAVLQSGGAHSIKMGQCPVGIVDNIQIMLSSGTFSSGTIYILER